MDLNRTPKSCSVQGSAEMSAEAWGVVSFLGTVNLFELRFGMLHQSANLYLDF